MTAVYFLRTGGEEKYSVGGLLTPRIRPKDWFSEDVMTRDVFENAEHVLSVLDREERDVSSERLHDVELVDSAVIALSEAAWPLVPALVKGGCRVATKVRVSGPKRFKLVYPGRALDSLDHTLSEVHLNEAAGAISHVRNRTLFDDQVDLPYMFQVLFKGPKKSGPSMDVFVTQEFADAYNALKLTGAEFHAVKRSKRSV